MNQCWVIVNLTPRNELQWNFIQNTKHFIHEKASEYIVSEMEAICPGGDELNHASKGDLVEISGFSIALIFLNYDRCLDNLFFWPVKFITQNKLSAGYFDSATCYRQTFYGLVNWNRAYQHSCGNLTWNYMHISGWCGKYYGRWKKYIMG